MAVGSISRYLHRMADLDEARLIEKLRAIEALYARPGSEGEKAAAGNAREVIRERLREMALASPPIEYRFSMADMWSRRVFVALLRRYDIQPYRFPGQRHTTVMATVSKRFVDETLWPEFEALDKALRAHLEEVTSRVVGEVIHADVSDAAVRTEPQLPLAPPAIQSSPEPASSSTRRRKKKKRKR